MPEEGHDGFDILGLTDDPQLVAQTEHAVGVGHRDLPVGVPDARDHELTVDQIAHVSHRASVEHRVGELHGDFLGEFLLLGECGQRFVLFFEFHAQGIADEDHREDDAHDTQRIGHGVAQRDAGIAESRGVGISLLCGAQSGGVGHGAREDADHRRNGRSGHDVDDIGRCDAQQDDRRGASHEGDSAVLERREESRADLQSDRKDEKDQSEFLHEVPHFAIDGHPEMAEQDADEQYPRDTQRNASDFDFSQQNADGDYQRENKYGMGDAVAEKQGIQPLHINLILCLLSSRAQNYYISQK